MPYPWRMVADLPPPAFLRVWRPRLTPQLELVLAENVMYDAPVHVHEELELSLAPLHPMELSLDGTRHFVPAGAVTVVPPGEAHRARSGEGASRFYSLRVQPQVLRESWKALAGGSLALPLLPPVQMNRALTLAFLTLHQLSGHAPGLSPSALSQQLRELLLLLLESGHPVQDAGRPDAPEAVRHARERMDDAPSAAISLTLLAAEVGLSPSHFVRVFREATGLTPHAYLLNVRVREAKTLLLGAEPLGHVAFTLGFASQSHFTEAFRQRVGVTPQQYRQDSQNLVDREKL